MQRSSINGARRAAAAIAIGATLAATAALAQSSGAPPWQPGAEAPANPMITPAGMANPLPSAPAAGADPAPAASRGAHPGESLHLTQKAWDDPRRNMGRGQVAPGYARLSWSESAILRINTREGLITTVLMPPGEVIQQLVVSDPGSIEAVPSPDKKVFVVKPTYPGIDGNIVVYGASGRTYNFYLQSTPYDSKVLPDVRVAVEAAAVGNAVDDIPYPTTMQGGRAVARPMRAGGTPDDPSAALTAPRAAQYRVGRDFAAVARTGPGRLRTDLRIMVSKPDDTIIAPVAAWRDDKFTYLDFGPRAASMNTWPVAALVVDRVESPVGTRVAGPDRSIMVVESLGDIVLRNGEHTVCIKLDVVNEDPRHPRVDEPYRDRPGLVAAADAGIPHDRGPAAEPGAALSGPYPVDKALALASDMVKGYRGLVHEADVTIQDASGRPLGRDEIARAPPSTPLSVRVASAERSFSERICRDLRYSRRSCRVL